MSAQKLISRISQMGCGFHGVTNVIAFSGGVDSSVVACLVHRAFPLNTVAVIGLSAALPQVQLDMARNVAKTIGIPLIEIPTTEGVNPEYIENIESWEIYQDKISFTSRGNEQHEIIMFNGTNADDKLDPSRLGLVAASNYSVKSPLDTLIKKEVRAIAKELHLPNANLSASPCLRSRLALGIEATKNQVEEAENIVRNFFQLQNEHVLRVRMLPGGRTAIELDSYKNVLNITNPTFTQSSGVEKQSVSLLDAKFVNGNETNLVQKLVDVGFDTNKVVIRRYKYGSVNGLHNNKYGSSVNGLHCDTN